MMKNMDAAVFLVLPVAELVAATYVAIAMAAAEIVKVPSFESCP